MSETSPIEDITDGDAAAPTPAAQMRVESRTVRHARRRERPAGTRPSVHAVGPEGDAPALPRAGRVVVWRRALRVQQWSKNLLLLLPAAAAHLHPTPQLVLQLVTGWLAFSLTASAVYLTNDLVDLPHDRRHATKRHRPLAAGTLAVRSAVTAIPLLLVGAALLAFTLPGSFRLALLAYVVLTTSYSFALKRRLLLDVMSLVLLYAVRVVAGSLLADVPLSDWFVAFFSFAFLGLALVKRTDELRRARMDDVAELDGRAYRAVDLPVLQAFGIAASLASAVIFGLYISSPASNALYPHDQRLWLALPVVLYWQIRMWVLAARGAIDEDPVAFAAHDRVTYLAAAVLAVLVWLSL